MTRGRRLPRGHHRGHRGRRRLRPRRWAARSSCWRSASADRRRRGVGVRVHPAMIPRTHPLAGVGDAFNAVFVEAEAAGQLMFYGRGAGGAPTASAVLGDLVAVARNRLAGGARRRRVARTRTCAVRPMGEVLDPLPRQPRRRRPGRRAGRGRAGVRRRTTCRIQTVRQDGRGDDAHAGASSPTRAPDAALAATVERPARAGRRCARSTSGDAGRGGAAMTLTGCRRGDRTPPWRGRDRGVPRPAAGRRRHAGRHPAARAARRCCRRRTLSERTGCEVYLKVEGANPTGSFKDRGMTVAITKAVAGRARRRSSAPRTGNTSASAAAYAARAGHDLRRARARRARSRSASWPRRSCTAPGCCRSTATSTTAWRSPASCPLDYPVALVNSVNPDRHRGPEDRRVRDRRRARRRPGHPLPAGRQRRQHHRVLEGLPRVRTPTASSTRPPRMCGFQAAGAAPIVHRRSRSPQPVDHRHRDPDRQPGVVDAGGRRPGRVRRPDRRGHRPGDPRRVPAARPRGGRLRRAGVGAPASPGCCRPPRPGGCRRASRSSARSPATASRTRTGRSPARRPRSPSRSTRSRGRGSARPGLTRPSDAVAAAA